MRHRVRRSLSALIAFAMLAANGEAAFAQTVPAPAASSAPAPGASATPAAPTYADLTHLTFTATGDLTATMVSPADKSVSEDGSPVVEVATARGGGVELNVNGENVPFSRIGKRVIYNKTGETHYFYYGVDLREGENDLDVTPLGANDARGKTTTYHLIGPGAPVSLSVSVDGSLKADGRTPAILQIKGIDRAGHHARPGSIVKVTVVSGDAKLQSMRKPKADADDPSGGVNADTSGADVAKAPAADATLSPNNVPVAPAPVGTGIEAGAFGAGPGAAPAGNAGISPGEPRNWNSIGDTDAQVSQVSVQLERGGVARLRLVPGLTPGEVKVRATYGDVVTDADEFVAPNLRKPLVVGLATAGLGSLPGVPGEPVDAPNGVNARRGRVALYGVGAISQIAQATFAYDTGTTLSQTLGTGAFTVDPNSRPYSTYGDGSSRRDDALSNDHLYARIDAGRSSAMWGEFQADTGGTSGIGGFSQLVDGAKVELATPNTRLVGFQAHNDIAYSRQIFTPSGLATIGTLLHPDIVIGSETLTLVSLDRRTGAVLAQTILVRNIDYTLDYTAGYLHFLNPPLPYDSFFNPQQLLVQYEYGGPGAGAETTGGRLSTTFGPNGNLRANVGYVNDSTGAANLSLLSEDVGGALGAGSWSVGHLATIGSNVGDPLAAVAQLGLSGNTHGDAYRGSLATNLGSTHVDLGIDTTSQGFNNPFGGLTTPGLLDYHVAISRHFGTSGDLTAQFDHQQNNVTGAEYGQSDGSLHAHVPVGRRLTLRGGVDVRTNTAYSGSGSIAALTTASALGQQVATVPTPAPAPTAAGYTAAAGTTVQAELGAAYKIGKSITVQADRIQTLGSQNTSSQPAQTTAEVDADFTKKGRVYVRQLWSDSAATGFASSTNGLVNAAGARSSTEVGVDRSLGTNTTVSTDYVLDRTDSGNDAYAALGVREQLVIGKNLKGEASLQRASSFGSDSSGNAAGGFNVYGLSLAYAIARFHATGQYQLRTGYTGGYTADVAAEGSLSPDFSAFVSVNSTSTSGGFDSVDSKATLAFRPSGNDRSVTLASFEAENGTIAELGTHAEVLSLEELYRPTHFTEIAGRYAYSLDGDQFYPAQTSLVGLRVDQRLTRRIDLAGEARWLSARNIPNASVTGFALEAGYRVGDGMRVAGGYNFSGSPDPSLIDAPTRRGFYGTVTSVIDRIFGWGADRP